MNYINIGLTDIAVVIQCSYIHSSFTLRHRFFFLLQRWKLLFPSLTDCRRFSSQLEPRSSSFLRS